MSHSLMIESPMMNWASTSRQFSGNLSLSMEPCKMPFCTATNSSRS